MRRLNTLLVVAFFLPGSVLAVQVEICNQSQVFLEVTEANEFLAEAAAGECFILEIKDKEKWLINFGMTRYLFDFLFLENCAQAGKAKLIATDEGKLYCNSTDQKQPKGFPMEVMKKIDLI